MNWDAQFFFYSVSLISINKRWFALFMKAWRNRKAWLPQRDRIDRKSIEIIASELYSIYINSTHLLSIAHDNVFLFCSIPSEWFRIADPSDLYKRNTYSGQRTRWLWEKRTPYRRSWFSETASPTHPSPWCLPCWCPGPAGCSPLQIAMILLIDAITPLLLRSSHRNWVRRKKKEKGYLRLADITKLVQKIRRFFFFFFFIKLYIHQIKAENRNFFKRRLKICFLNERRASTWLNIRFKVDLIIYIDNWYGRINKDLLHRLNMYRQTKHRHASTFILKWHTTHEFRTQSTT